MVRLMVRHTVEEAQALAAPEREGVSVEVTLTVPLTVTVKEALCERDCVPQLEKERDTVGESELL